MSFDPCNCLLFQQFIGTPTPKVGTHLGVWGFILSTFLHSREHEMWLPSSFLARTFASLYLGRDFKVGLQQNLSMKYDITLGRGMEPWDLKVIYFNVFKVLPSFYMQRVLMAL